MSFLSMLGLVKKPKPITPELVSSVWQYMSKVYSTSVITKSTSTNMQIVGAFLDKLGIQNKDNFMSNYTTTIGHSIYIPFTIGIPSGLWTLENQIIVCAHEHQHVVQANNEGMFKFTMNYLFSADSRAQYETEAYRSTLELFWYYHKALPDNLHPLASMLLPYNLTEQHVAVAEIALSSAARMIKSGLVLNQATKSALSVL
jgi:hypothetical protein